MAYGPQKVIVVAGVNKIVKTIHDGFKRIREVAAPKNAVRLEKKTPCAKTGTCKVCNSPERICRVKSVITRPLPNRVYIYLFKEDIGY